MTSAADDVSLDLVWTPYILTEDVCGFPQSFQTNIEIVSLFGQDSFLTNPFPSTISHPATLRCVVSTETVELPRLVSLAAASGTEGSKGQMS
jgi:hypothetical protein